MSPVTPSVLETQTSFLQHAERYGEKLQEVFTAFDWQPVSILADTLEHAWKHGHQVFLCGNGGSAANATHLANDYLYGIGAGEGPGLRVNALTANPAVLTCLANDVHYEQVFSAQLSVLAKPDDVLIALSGSGNSPNIVQALKMGQEMAMKTFAILGYSGGKALSLAEVPIHFPIDDMQIAEDLQLMVGHMLMQWLQSRRLSQV
tara:strand:+ start:75233 stop:75844 length:612 start_codon:yes stop_codon:yes gene_type:complete